MKRMNRFPHIVAATSLSLLASACASTSGDYPSLAIRDAERATGSMEPAPADEAPAPAPPLSPDFVERLAQIGEQARAAHQAFMAEVPAARRRVRAGGNASITTNAGAAAEVALASLESARSTTAVSLVDLDKLLVERAIALEPVEAVSELRQEVEALVAEEDAILAELR